MASIRDRHRFEFVNDAHAVQGVHGKVDSIQPMQAGVGVVNNRLGDKRSRLRVENRQPNVIVIRDAGHIEILAADI